MRELRRIRRYLLARIHPFEDLRAYEKGVHDALEAVKDVLAHPDRQHLHRWARVDDETATSGRML